MWSLHLIFLKDFFCFVYFFKNCRDVAKNEKEKHFEENYRDTVMRARALMVEEGELGFHPFRRLEGLHKHPESIILDSFFLYGLFSHTIVLILIYVT